MTEADRIKVQIATYRDALDICRRAGGEAKDDARDIPAGGKHRIATDIQHQISRLQFRLRQLERTAA